MNIATSVKDCTVKIRILTKLKPIALRKAKLAYNFGLSECNRVKVNGYTFKGSNSSILIFAFLPSRGPFLNERICNFFALRVDHLLPGKQILDLFPFLKTAVKHDRVPINLKLAFLTVYFLSLTHCIQVDSSTVICSKSPIVILGVYFVALFLFLTKNLVNKQCRPSRPTLHGN